MCKATTSHRACGRAAVRRGRRWRECGDRGCRQPKTSAAVAGVSGRLQPHPAQHRGAFVRPAGVRPTDQHGVDQAGCQQRPQLGRRPAPVDDFQHSAQRGVGEDRRLTHRCGAPAPPVGLGLPGGSSLYGGARGPGAAQRRVR